MTVTLDFSALVTEDRVLSAYNGATGCMCGCLGDYAYPTAYRAEAGANRGYEVRDEEVSDRKVRSRLNRLLKMAKAGDYDALRLHDFGLFLERNGRTHAVYFRETK